MSYENVTSYLPSSSSSSSSNSVMSVPTVGPTTTTTFQFFDHPLTSSSSLQSHQDYYGGGGGGGRLTSSVIPIVASSFQKVNPPAELMMISPSSRVFITIYCLLFIVGTVGNLFVFLTVGTELWRKCHRSRIKVLILHLSVADMFVILFVIPIEVFWRITVSWEGGEVLCKASQFFRAFGLYLSSNVIICISLDRFYVIVSPLKAIGGMRRVKNMLIIAWTCAILSATPQMLVFSVESHPVFLSFSLCATYGFFDSPDDETLYNMLSVSAMYFAPLIVILFTYVGVLIKVTRRSRQHQNVNNFQQRILQQRLLLHHHNNRHYTATHHRPTGSPALSSDPGLMMTSRILLKRTFARHGHPHPVTSFCASGSASGIAIANGVTGSASFGGGRRGSQFLRMSSPINNINRSRRHAFFLTMIIITVFVFLWSPYYLLLLWHVVDWDSAKMVDARVQQAFFIMAVSNSCLNPIIYGNACCRKPPNISTANASDDQGQRRELTCDTGPF